MTTPPREPYRPTLTRDADVTEMWRTIIDPLGWHTRRLYFMLVDPWGRPNPQIVEIDEMPETFGAEDAAEFVDFLHHLLGDFGFDETGSAAMMLARPGSATITDGDRAFCRELYGAASRAGVRLELLHVGTDTAIVPAPMDEVLPRTA